ncbi:hypothetical protein BGW80DRAFT_1402371 [Lactifluus volemus]|nr:hypothetical protein BGW80DRAFT_1402371 [Lactifluus volemus]
MMARGYTPRTLAQPAPPCESVASRVETAVTMLHATGKHDERNLVRGMHEAMETSSTSYMEDAMGYTTAVSTPQDQVDSFMRQMAEEVNLGLQQDLADKEVPSLAPPERSAVIGVEDSTLADRLRALRPAT